MVACAAQCHARLLFTPALLVLPSLEAAAEEERRVETCREEFECHLAAAKPVEMPCLLAAAKPVEMPCLCCNTWPLSSAPSVDMSRQP